MTTKAMSKREAISERASAVAQDFQDVRSAAKQMATDSVDMLRQTASDVLYDSQDKAQNARQRIEAAFRDRPVQTLLMGVAVGIVLGLFFKRR